MQGVKHVCNMVIIYAKEKRALLWPTLERLCTKKRSSSPLALFNGFTSLLTPGKKKKNRVSNIPRFPKREPTVRRLIPGFSGGIFCTWFSLPPSLSPSDLSPTTSSLTPKRRVLGTEIPMENRPCVSKAKLLPFFCQIGERERREGNYVRI